MVLPSGDSRGWIAPRAFGTYTAAGPSTDLSPRDQISTSAKRRTVPSWTRRRRSMGSPPGKQPEFEASSKGHPMSPIDLVIPQHRLR